MCSRCASQFRQPGSHLRVSGAFCKGKAGTDSGHLAPRAAESPSHKNLRGALTQLQKLRKAPRSRSPLPPKAARRQETSSQGRDVCSAYLSNVTNKNQARADLLTSKKISSLPLWRGFVVACQPQPASNRSQNTLSLLSKASKLIFCAFSCFSRTKTRSCPHPNLACGLPDGLPLRCLGGGAMLRHDRLIPRIFSFCSRLFCEYR